MRTKIMLMTAVILSAAIMPSAANFASSVKSAPLMLEGAIPGGGILNRPVNLDDVRSAIKAKGAKWEAEENSISRLSPEERKKMIAASDLQLVSASTAITAAPFEALATSLDWRNNGGNFVTPIKNQGSCGSCWAFATTATGESANLIKGKTTYAQNPLDLSEQVMVSCSGAGSCNGGSSASASGFLVTTGLPVESCYAYTATDGSCTSACADWKNNTYKIDNNVRIATDVTAIKNALASYGPVTASFYVYTDFYYYKSGIYSYTSGSLEGAHAISIIGYDDVTQSFLVKNSWGAGWGEAGYFRIAYTELATQTKFAYNVLAYNTITPDTIAPTASIIAPSGSSSVSSLATVDVVAADNIGVSRVDLFVNDKLYATDTAAPYSIQWNTYSVMNGTASLVAYAYDSSGNKGASQTVIVNVNNVSDVTLPTVVIASPINGSSVSGNVSISGSASDNIGVLSMAIYIDGTRVATANASTISYVWSTKKLPLGLHAIKIEAQDLAGNIGSVTNTVNLSQATGRRTK